MAKGNPKRNNETPIVHRANVAAFLKLDEDTLRKRGVRDGLYNKKDCIEIPINNIKGFESFIQFRTGLKKSGNKDNRFMVQKGSKITLMGLERIITYVHEKYPILWGVEGASDMWVLDEAGRASVGRIGANYWDQAEAEEIYKDFEKVLVVLEDDIGGENTLKTLKREVVGSSIEKKIYLVRPTDMVHKGKAINDLRDLRDECGSAKEFKRKLTLIEKEAISLTDYLAEIRAERRKQYQFLDHSDDVVGEYVKAVQKEGFVNEALNLRAIVLAAGTITDPVPVCPITKGDSSAGKSAALKAVLELIPEERKYVVTSSSPLGIIYNEEMDLRNSILMIEELSGLNSDPQGLSIIRCIISEGFVNHLTVNDGEGEAIFKAGPISFWSCTTKVFIDVELDTRVLSLYIDDSVDQNGDVIDDITARESAEDDQVFEVDREPYIVRFADMIEDQIKVWIPWANKLYRMSPLLKQHTRIRRDIKKALLLIKSDARFNHQNLKYHDGKGAYIADRSTYTHVKPILEDMFGYVLNTKVSDTVRETVEKVRELTEGNARRDDKNMVTVNNQQLKHVLGLKSDSAVTQRVQKAEKAGFLKNLKTSSRGENKLVIGDVPVPDGEAVLPTVEELFADVSAFRFIFGEDRPVFEDEEGLKIRQGDLDGPDSECPDCEEWHYWSNQGKWVCGICVAPPFEFEYIAGLTEGGDYLVEEPI